MTDTWQQPTLEAQIGDSRAPWTIMHGFYIVMGGLAIRIPHDLPESRKFLPKNIEKNHFIVSEFCFEHLVKNDPDGTDIFTLSEEEIKSKSKANWLAKTLICIQALWFMAQCLNRREYFQSLSDFNDII